MKKMLSSVYIVMFLLVMAVGLAACNGEPSGADGNLNEATENQQYTAPPPEEPEVAEEPEYIESPADTEETADGVYVESEDGSNGDASGHTGGVALGLTITRLEYEEGPGQLADIDFMHTVDLGDGIHGTGIGDTLMIRTFTTLREFAVISMENDMADDEVVFIPAGTIGGMVETFLPGEAFIIYSYVSAGTIPSRAITFLDENDQRWFFAISQNQAYPDEGDAYLLISLDSSHPYEALTFISR